MIGAGDVITTGPKSLAVIDLTNGTTLKLKENDPRHRLHR